MLVSNFAVPVMHGTGREPLTLVLGFGHIDCGPKHDDHTRDSRYTP